MTNRDYERVEKALGFLEVNFRQQPQLAEVADHVGVSEYHLQRVFKRWAGVSPKRFLQFLTVESAKRMLQDSRSVLDTSLDLGLSGPSRLHDLFVTIEAVTPGDFKSQGRALHVDHGWQSTPFGKCFLATTRRGICALEFASQPPSEDPLQRLMARWPEATFRADNEQIARLVRRVFKPAVDDNPLSLALEGTNFQLRVWSALIHIPLGSVVAYEDVARSLSRPSAARAVGRAVGDNHVGYLIPCHRVIRKMGVISDYRWGRLRKKAMLAWEAVQAGSR